MNIVVNTAPFWAVILAWCLINEKINKVQAFALVISFLGIGLISNTFKKKNEEKDGDHYLWIAGIFCILITAWCHAGASVFMRKLQDIHYSAILFYSGVMGFVVALVMLMGVHVYTTMPFHLFNYSLQ